MAPSMVAAAADGKGFNGVEHNFAHLLKGVKYLSGSGISKVPEKYILPAQERPMRREAEPDPLKLIALPLLDFSELQGPNNDAALKSLSDACQDYGFFQLVNHGIPEEVTKGIVEVSKEFFEMPFEERSKYMSSDMYSPVRYGTSFNQSKDKVFCWRDFLKLTCQPMEEVLPHWPSSPPHMRRELAASYAKAAKNLSIALTGAIFRGLEIDQVEEHGAMIEEFKAGSQLMVMNCYPQCPQPDLTLGMPPHSDYGFLTLLLQDQVEGLQIQHRDEWVMVQPVPNALVINVGDHLEIFSNGRYKSVLHRVLANSTQHRVSVASIHTLSSNRTIRPSPSLVDDANPPRYKDTDFASFLDYVSSREPKNKDFLESRKVTR
ncbi:hypothetical protein MLD38_033123 [Melastoma candidum]|uniref:Uncharacterized protein n=1 Tax=Melastoma candidum TaxID=119954 RepID=A0ACB9M5Q9_9MYRT|nr:hypothetical protein MLD38_033123 [Melastoma candidum]